MTTTPSPVTLCGEELPIPSPRCTLPRGHAGRHETVEIPEPLAEAAAAAVRMSDTLEAERLQLREERAGSRRATIALRHRLRLIGFVMIAITATNCVAFLHYLWVMYGR